ncbi:hypothetical protein PRK78_002472 [Emydomyces testavorans]|uniref:GST N-terminal domain-containing protein n=1 Tax=Emydomyces testavorans TaxID=2070801 RepID=A0AAF0IHL4_9EURO|nr:hypothetical protein PRK78_002472 [Emydomyces testavorans]
MAGQGAKVHFLDITSTFPGPNKSWSPNTLRTRLVLNYKQIPYTQSYLPYPSIAPVLRSLRLPPLSNGPVPYTLPAIIHAASIPGTPTRHALNDSWPIAQHLEHAFPAPQHPSIFPTPASYPLAVAVQTILADTMRQGMAVHIPKVAAYLEPSCAEYFSRTRAVRFGKSLPEFAAKGAELERVWAEMETGFGTLAAILRGAEGVEKKAGPFFEGDQVGYADLVLMAMFGWYMRNDRADWERLMDIGKEGEFGRLWEACLPWLEGQGEEVEFPVPVEEDDDEGSAVDSGPILFKSS